MGNTFETELQDLISKYKETMEPEDMQSELELALYRLREENDQEEIEQ